jgi:predicted O-methyltransferase YrrM
MPHNSESLRRAFGYFFPNELSTLKALVYLVPHSPCVVINIGAGAGTSGLAFLESRDDIELHTVDITDESSPFGCLHAEREVCRDAGYVLGDRWFQHHIDSKQLSIQWQAGPVDVVFVDGDHSYAGCVGDIMGWLSHIRTGGFMAVHDYRKGDLLYPSDGDVRPHPLKWEGVDEAVDAYLKSQFDVFALVESLIVFQVK